MKVAVGSDHGGFDLKEKIKEYLKKCGITYEDYGTFSLESVDYPDFAFKVAGAVAAGEFDKGILCCGTGLGVAITANKIPSIRAVTCSETFSARASREHNNANILCLGGRVVGPGLAQEIVGVWLNSEFSGGRHEKRVEKIREIEYQQYEGEKTDA